MRKNSIMEPIKVSVGVGRLCFLDRGVIHGWRKGEIPVGAKWFTNTIQVIERWRLAAFLDVVGHRNAIASIGIGKTRHGRVFLTG